MDVDARFIICVAVTSMFLEFAFSSPHFAFAGESRLARHEFVPAASTRMGKSDLLAAPHKTNASHGADGDSRAGNKVKSVASGGASHHSGPSAHVPHEMTGKDGAPMVLVPAGEFAMGSDKGDEDEIPVHRVILNAVYIDKFEVTNGRFAKFVDAIQSEPPWGFADKDTPVIYADRPVRWV
ncbi:MAG: SUMF1/EgtB/PvdO family nonheme iron enzyme, partial [Nitrospira sp.]|nr:SUMF1/EgtB/PvdO family nonheme iron enzyme [Nitrospira sp.]